MARSSTPARKSNLGLERLDDRLTPSAYSDGFENPTLNSFWGTRTDSGSISSVTSPVHGGGRAVQFNSVSTGANKYIELNHTFPTPVYGRASVWVYDTGADVGSSNYLALMLTRSTGVYEQQLIVGYDYDLGPNNGGNYYVGPGDINSGVDRTRNWHEFVIDTTPVSLRFYIDGQLVRSEARGFAFDHLYLTMFGPSWRPAWTGHFDDFEFYEYLPDLTVGNAVVTEGDTGTRNLTFPVQLSEPWSRPVTVSFATADWSATVADNDYVAKSDTLTFAPGETVKYVTVTVNGDLNVESNEVVRLLLSDPANARLAGEVGYGTIVNDDGLGFETRVNTTTAEDQNQGRVAVDAVGNFVVVWTSQGQDGSGAGVYARRYGANGQALGGEFRVNQTTSGRQSQPRVACDAAGNFVVVWDGNGVSDSSGVFARMYSYTGQPRTGEFRVNTATDNDQMDSSIAMNALGEFVITWSSINQAAANSLWDIYCQRFNAAGGRVGGEFRVNTYIPDNQDPSKVAINNRGQFVVAWNTKDADGDGFGVKARRYDANGSPIGEELLVNTATAGNQNVWATGIDDFGRLMVIWSSPPVDGADTSGQGLYLQRYDAAGNRLGGQTLVNQYTAGDQIYGALAVNALGEFVVAWESGGQDGSDFGVYARRYDSAGTPVTPEFRVNTTTAGGQRLPTIDLTDAGRVVVAWHGNGPGDTQGVFVQRFGEPEKVYIKGGTGGPDGGVAPPWVVSIDDTTKTGSTIQTGDSTTSDMTTKSDEPERVKSVAWSQEVSEPTETRLAIPISLPLVNFSGSDHLPLTADLFAPFVG
jgi:hypothetical protein